MFLHFWEQGIPSHLFLTSLSPHPSAPSLQQVRVQHTSSPKYTLSLLHSTASSLAHTLSPLQQPCVHLTVHQTDLSDWALVKHQPQYADPIQNHISFPASSKQNGKPNRASTASCNPYQVPYTLGSRSIYSPLSIQLFRLLGLPKYSQEICGAPSHTVYPTSFHLLHG